ncbi:hypothetical protein [Pseudomonas sp. MYb185]|uniref:hypothetical protein n=1 Tax=Pseudomonas sp. MYb185 TaxID=1848729 RepID=UPI000CFAC489|nr:hypothetical protein [Pseudomonas sp. MYb185]PRB81362.1 hypothetical protein CQ007_09405 [Pseudomonas sp. MYb185]
MYENKNEPLIARRDFSRRMFLHVLAALVLVLATLVAGIAGHMYFDNMEPGRALIASVTLSSGLGLSIFPESTSGQVFASLYGFFSSYVFIATSTIVIAPVLHRILHKFHLDEE